MRNIVKPYSMCKIVIFSRQTRFGIVARSVMIDLSYSFGSGKTSAKRKVIINNDDLLQNTGVR